MRKCVNSQTTSFYAKINRIGDFLKASLFGRHEQGSCQRKGYGFYLSESRQAVNIPARFVGGGGGFKLHIRKEIV